MTVPFSSIDFKVGQGCFFSSVSKLDGSSSTIAIRKSAQSDNSFSTVWMKHRPRRVWKFGFKKSF